MKKTFGCFKKRSSSAGLALTEVAIVMGVIGIVAGAIWATASAVRARQPILDTVQVVTDVASNVRGVYTGFPNAVPPGAIANAISRGLFPESVVNEDKSDTINPWGGSYTLAFQGGAASVGRGFTLALSLSPTLPASQRKEICVSLATRITGTSSATPAFDGNGIPNAVPNIDPVQGNAPSYVLLNDGGTWENVTTSTVEDILSDINNCTGVGFYFRL